MEAAACLSLWPFTCFSWCLVLLSWLLIAKQNNPRFPEVRFQLSASLPKHSALSPTSGEHTKSYSWACTTEETSAFNCQVPHLLPVSGSGSLVLALVTFACLFSGVLGTPGRLDRGVMKGNRLSLPILFSLLWMFSFFYRYYHLFLEEEE